RPLGALPLTLAQFVLFTLLFFQIACHQGAEHYRWDGRPGWQGWLWFSAAHAIRAGDLFDVLDAYGQPASSVRHAGHLTSAALVAFHVVMGLFLVSLLLEGIRRGRRGIGREVEAASALRLMARWVLGCFVFLFLLLWLITVTGGWSSPWRGWPAEDVVLWPLDNFLRVIDFADVLEIYRARLNHVPPTW